MSTILLAALEAAKRTRQGCSALKSRAITAAERTRPGRVAIALARFAWRRLPKWPRRALALCLAIPGPQDEAIAAVAIAVYLLAVLAVSRPARAELSAAVSAAWKGRQ